MADKVTTYNRPYHQSEDTDKVIELFAPWMEMTGKRSVGYQIVNALYGQYGEICRETIDDTAQNFHVATADWNEPRLVYETVHSTASGSIGKLNTVTAGYDYNEAHSVPSGTLGVGTWTLYNSDDEESFFHSPPTRLSWNPINDIYPTGMISDLTGLTYVKDWYKVDASGIMLIPKQDVYIVNQSSSTPAPGNILSTVVYNKDFVVLDSYDYGLGVQDYEHAGYYEVISDPSGYTLEYNPLIDTIAIYDYLNVNTYGNAQVISNAYYTIASGTTDYVTTTTIAMSGTNPYNLDEIGHSNYFLTYQYKKMDYPSYITTGGSKWHTQKMASPPIFTSYPADYAGTIVKHEMAASASGDLALLRVDPRDMRPGASGDIRFTYIDYIDTDWYNINNYEVDVGSSCTNFYLVYPSGTHVYSSTGDITKDFSISATGTIIYIGSNSNIGDPTPYTVRSYYTGRKTYSGIIAVQSFSSLSGGVDPYPFDYMIEDDYVIPYSILPISESNDAVKTSLLAATGDQFLVTTQLLFTGLAYDKDKEYMWMLESNNMMLYKLRVSDGAIIEKHAIFKEPSFYIGGYKSTVNVRPDRYRDDTQEYPFISYNKDNYNRSGKGMVYFKDFLYIVASGTSISIADNDQKYPVGGYGIYRLNTYSNDMDIEYGTDHKEKWPHYPLPISGVISGIVYTTCKDVTDICIDNDNDFRVLDGNTVRVLTPRYDYVLVDSSEGMVRGTVYYREQYPSGVTVVGYTEAAY